MEAPRRARSAGLPTLEDGIRAGSWLWPARFAHQEAGGHPGKQYPGLDRINVGSVIGTPQSVILEQLQALGKDVMPKFKAKK